jgi:hypothetical protein
MSALVPSRWLSTLLIVVCSVVLPCPTSGEVGELLAVDPGCPEKKDDRGQRSSDSLEDPKEMGSVRSSAVRAVLRSRDVYIFRVKSLPGNPPLV